MSYTNASNGTNLWLYTSLPNMDIDKICFLKQPTAYDMSVKISLTYLFMTMILGKSTTNYFKLKSIYLISKCNQWTDRLIGIGVSVPDY